MDVAIRGAPVDSNTPGFAFAPRQRTFKCFSDKDTSGLLRKWGIVPHVRMSEFGFRQGLALGNDKQVERFLLDFFNSADVQRHLASGGEGKKATPSGSFASLEWERVPCTLVKTAVFKKFEEASLVSHTGSIRGCMDEVYDGITSCNLIVDMFLNEDTENMDVLEENEMEEVLVRIFKMLVCGGGMNQNDEKLSPYTQAATMMYKDLIAVQKNPSSGAIETVSSVFSISGGKDGNLFPHPDSPHNVCFVAVNPILRTATFFSFAFIPWC